MTADACQPAGSPSQRSQVLDLATSPAFAAACLAVAGLAARHVLQFQCPFRASTGLDCPVCGGTRAVLAAAHGRAIEAFHDNAALMVGTLLTMVVIATPLRQTSFGLSLRRRANSVSPWAWVSVIVLWTVVRNLPWLRWLAPDHHSRIVVPHQPGPGPLQV